MSGDIVVIPPGPAGALAVDINYTGPAGANGVGVPAGGTTGQILAKNSNTDYDTEWVDDAGGGTAIMDATTVTPGAGDFFPFINDGLTPAKVEATYFASAAALTSGLAGKADTSALTSGLAAKLDTSAAPELIRDTMAAALVAGPNITITPNDGADTIEIAATGGGSATYFLPYTF